MFIQSPRREETYRKKRDHYGRSEAVRDVEDHGEQIVAIVAAHLVHSAEHGADPNERDVAEHRVLCVRCCYSSCIYKCVCVRPAARQWAIGGVHRTRCAARVAIDADECAESEQRINQTSQKGREAEDVRIHDARRERENRRVSGSNEQVDDRAVH